MKEEIARKWIEELRSGRHRQGHKRLLRDNGSLCCLGVLQVKVLELPIPHDMPGVLSIEAMRLSEIKSHAAEFAGEEGIDCLARLNDFAWLDFLEIADIIEARWQEL